VPDSVGAIQWSPAVTTISGNRRIMFRFVDSDAFDVDLVDSR